VVSQKSTDIFGDPDFDLICTSHIERQNGSLRQCLKNPKATGMEDPLASFEDVHRELICRFLSLVRDNYAKADKASYFLERRAGVSNACAITNLRDVLSHLATLLDPTTPPDKRADQLSNGEEHLRRAIIEPYEMP
jgi:hypothetical protein